MPYQKGRQPTEGQQVFVAEMLRNGGNAVGAYRVAFPASSNGAHLSARASKLRHHPWVVGKLAEAGSATARAVDKAVDRYQITADRIADELARMAFTRVDQLATVQTVGGKQVLMVRDFASIDPDALAAVAKVRRTADGIVVELTDKRGALMDLARLKGWVADKPAASGNLVMLKIER